jgi:CheY-like chemotaxis protein
VEAANGIEALARLAEQPFDIVLLDVHMPVMDGKEAIRRIRASGQPWKDIPVIALTADAMSGDREKLSSRWAWSDYVSKPIDARELATKYRRPAQAPPARRRSRSLNLSRPGLPNPAGPALLMREGRGSRDRAVRRSRRVSPWRMCFSLI